MTAVPHGERGRDPTAAYLAPLAVYLIGTSLASSRPEFYPLAYAAVAVATLIAIGWALPRLTVLRPHRSVLPGIVVGLVGIAAWIGLCELELESWLAGYLPDWISPGPRVGFNPFASISQPSLAWAFIAVRMIGLAVLVPIAEEIFWRGFLLRWTIAERWREVPVGRYELKSFLIVTLLFTLAHPEWFAAATYAVLLNGLLYWKKDLWQCVVAHAVSNAVLGAYVLGTERWELW